MSKGRSLSRYSIYRLRVKRARETAARLEYFRQRLLDIKHRHSSCPGIIKSATSPQQPPVQKAEDREDDVVCQQTTSGAGAISTNDLVSVLQRWCQESFPTSTQLQNLVHHLRKFLPGLARDHRMISLLHRTLISPVAGLSTAPTVKYPVMRLNSLPVTDSAGLNLSISKEKATSQSSFLQNKDYGEAIFKALQSIKEEFKDRFEHLDSRIAAISEQMNKCHKDILRKIGNQSPIQPRWRPWFPLETVTDLNTMEHNLQDENCRAEVVAYVQMTPAGSIQDRTKSCLSRTVSNDLSRHLSWQGTHNKHPFGTTSLWALILETLAASYSDRETSARVIRQTCVTWFQNARDRSGGRSRRRYTYPEMPLFESNNENISVKEEEIEQMSKTYMNT